MILTPAERRAVVLVVALLVLGTLWDARPLPPRARRPQAAVVASGGSDSTRVPSAASGAAGAPLDLNRATLEQLDALPGVGPVLAGRILEQRRRQGGFHDVRDLRGVRGIGPRLYARLEPRVTVRSPVPGR